MLVLVVLLANSPSVLAREITVLGRAGLEAQDMEIAVGRAMEQAV